MAWISTVATLQSQPATRRRWLAIARAVWALLVGFDLLLFSISLGPSYALFRQPCASANQVDCSSAQLVLADWGAMQTHGITPDAYATFALAVVVAASLIFFAVGFLIAWRKWGELMGLFVSALLITFGSTGVSDTLANGPSGTPTGAAAIFVSVVGSIQFGVVICSYPALATFMLTFPTGRFAPRWTALIVLLWIIQFGLFIAAPPTIVLLISVCVTWGSCALVQIYRYRQVYTPIQRQQTKWVVFSLAVAVAMEPVLSLPPLIWPDLNAPGSLFRLAGVVGLALFWAPISLGVGIAILRSRLYDIDLLINRALVYGLLTAILGGVYATGVIGGQRLVSALTGVQGQESPVSIVLTTLVVAALFQPLRRRLQALIDRRFFRSKYNAARAVAGFSATLRSEVNLAGLTQHLLDIVDTTMRPEHVSLWLNPRSEAVSQRRPTSVSQRDSISIS
ncbi:MAG TPA: hypothetical protein VFN78_06190 [Ktedonobacterales bacterium]|nr:hypothetical protein [Ktedonobacterales bacterium]